MEGLGKVYNLFVNGKTIFQEAKGNRNLHVNFNLTQDKKTNMLSKSLAKTNALFYY